MKNDHFLDTDHTLSLDESVRIINQEIQWCYRNLSNKNYGSKKFKKGFIKGLEQAKFLIIKMAEVTEDVP